MQKLPYKHFGFSILTFNPRHIIAANFFAVYICHDYNNGKFTYLIEFRDCHTTFATTGEKTND